MLLKRNSLSLLILAAMIISSVTQYASLADMLPIHFGFSGEVEQYGPKLPAVMKFPALLLGLMLFTNIFIYFSPKKFAMTDSRRALDRSILGVGLLFLGLHLGLTLTPDVMTVNSTATQLFSLGVAGFMMVVGNVFGKLQQNFIVGVKLPWTIASEANWKATHRFSGKLMVALGFTLLLSVPFYANFSVSLSFLLVDGLISCAYSFLYYLRYER